VPFDLHAPQTWHVAPARLALRGFAPALTRRPLRGVAPALARRPLRVFTPALACLLAGVTLAAHAAHPALTEDTGTQGTGRVELELGASVVRPPEGRVTALEPQLSIGVTDHVDAIVRPTLLWSASTDGGTRGAAATTTDIKWRFLDVDGVHVGLRAGIDWPTGSRRLGGDRTSAHALLAVSRSVGDATMSLNVGVERHRAEDGERPLIAALAMGVLYPIGPRVTLVADVGLASNPDASRATTPAVASVGMIARITPWLDVDVGYRGGVNAVARPHAVLAGATLRW
jgi:hypothetical protein